MFAKWLDFFSSVDPDQSVFVCFMKLSGRLEAEGGRSIRCVRPDDGQLARRPGRGAGAGEGNGTSRDPGRMDRHRQVRATRSRRSRDLFLAHLPVRRPRGRWRTADVRVLAIL